MNDPLFGNKLAGAILTALLIFFGLPQLANALMGEGGHHGAAHGEEHHPFPAFPVEFAVAGAAGAEAAAPVDLGTSLAAASASSGQRRAAICASCHSFEKGGANGTGPNLWDIVGRPVAAIDGFGYSSALKSFGGTWTYERLDAYLANSQSYVPGTNMNQRFPKPEQRADLLAFMQSLADNPVPFPAPAAAASNEEAGD